MYQVHSGQSSKDNSTNLDGFEAIKPEHVNILLSINMLNEGYHLENGIDCAIFLRKTDSTIIYSQQRGRLFSSKSKKKPVALDLVCNIENNGKLIESINNAAKTKTKKVTCSIIDNIPFIIDDLVLGLVDIRNRLLLTDPVYQFTELVKKCKADPTYIPSIGTKTTLYGYILKRKYQGDSDAIMVWERIKKNTRTDEIAKFIKLEAEKCKKDEKYIPEIKYRSKVYNYIQNHRSGGICPNPDCDIVWKRKYTRTGELVEIVKMEAEKCEKDKKYVPEIKVGGRVYFYIQNHKSGSKYPHNPDCDIVWERIKYTGKLAEVVKMEAEKCRKDKKYIPEIKVNSGVYNYIQNHRSGSKYPHNPDCDIVWERIKDTKTDEMAEVVKMEAEKCKKDKKYIPEIKNKSKVYNYIQNHRSSSKFSHNPNCDIVWERIKDTRTDESARFIKLEAEKCKKDKKYVPEIEVCSRVYFYIRNHRSGSKFSYDPNCDIVWERIRRK